ncbi:hypothetical protein K1720_02620 [Thermococcus argininiproducens]|uniref:Succinate dehydrogenase n=1 Tax=Thermococcus argininiproducens TaxID=2866384 RepID=A0A9E7MB41_9EURY|nr:hypothetical protein [Thermococcus argininiproducens]USH00381.1 hypothetical protein K1720_02620 [Thermococcus argininiproducens]
MRAFKIVELTSIPLFILSLILVLSGYGIISPKTLNTFTFGLLSYENSSSVHSYVLIRYGFTALLLLHSYAGFEIFGLKKIRNPKVRTVLSHSLLVVVLYTLWVVTVVELRTLF